MESLVVISGKIWAFLVHTVPLAFGVALSHHLDKKTVFTTLAKRLTSYFFGIGLAFLFTRYLVEKGQLQIMTYEFALVQVTAAAISVKVFEKKISALTKALSK
jgi:hypothetical protein